MSKNDSSSPIAGYDQIAADFDWERGPKPWEWPYFQKLAQTLPSSATVLDCGCGCGHLGIAKLLSKGCRVIGLDGSGEMLALFRNRYPGIVTIQADMRDYQPDEPLNAVIAWDSFFHLSQEDQQLMIVRWASWLRPGGQLLFTSGPENRAIEGQMFGVTFHYASFAEEEYRTMLADAGFMEITSTFDEPGANIHKVWTARRSR